MTTREGRFNLGVGLIIIAVTINSMLGLGATTAAQGTADYRGVQLQDLGRTTDQCVQSSTSTDSPVCQQAAVKAREAQAQPVIVNVPPRRTDAEVKDLIEQTIREHPELIPRGAKGEGYVLTDADKQAIADMVLGKIPVPKDGAPGLDAVVDYDTIVQAVLALIPVARDGQSPPCLDTPAQCQGLNGLDGEPGRGILNRQYILVDSPGWLSPPLPPGKKCVERTMYSAAPLQVDLAVGGSLCEG